MCRTLTVVKILNITPMYFPFARGGERHATEVSERLAARGHEITVVTTNAVSERGLQEGADGGLPKAESINGVRVLRVPATDGALPGILNFGLRLKGGYRSLNYLFTPAGLKVFSRPPRNLGFFRSILRSDADLVVSWNWYWPPAYQAYLAKSFKRFRLVGIPFFHPADGWVRGALYDRMIAASDALVVNTQYEKDFILSRVPDLSKIRVLGPGVEPALFKQRNGARFRSRHGIGGALLVGYMGTLSKHKGVDKIVEAMPRVWEWNSDVCLVLAGFSDDRFTRLNQVLQSLSPEQRKRIFLLPDIPEAEKADLYDALDVFVMPSIGESFGISYLEAWMCGKPVIGSRIGSTACVIEEGVDGLLVEPEDPCDIGRAIVELLADPNRRLQMGARGHAKTMERFTWEGICDRLERFFSEVVAEAPGRRLCHWRRGESPSVPL
jgi:glycosyltransferase involved in cell wall biosynthesis